jgi:hypothetical protein
MECCIPFNKTNRTNRKAKSTTAKPLTLLLLFLLLEALPVEYEVVESMKNSVRGKTKGEQAQVHTSLRAERKSIYDVRINVATACYIREWQVTCS